MKILIIGERYSANLGDPIICESVYYLLKQEDSRLEIDFLDLSGLRDYETVDGSLTRAGRSRLKRKISSAFTGLGLDTDYLAFKSYHDKNKAYFHRQIDRKDYDLAIFAGGQMFLDYFVFPIQTIVDHLSRCNIPVIFNACGSGQIASRKMRRILGQSLAADNVRLISGRDDLDAIRALPGVGDPDLVRTHDPALWAREVYGVTRTESDTIGLGFIFAYNIGYKEMLAFWTGIIRALDRRAMPWQAFCNGSPRDYEFAKKVLTGMNYGPDEISERLLSAPRRPEELVEIIGGFKGIISFRLHSHVLACSLDVPGIAIHWDDKLTYFFDSLGLGDRVFSLEAEAGRVIGALKEALDTGYDRDLIESYKESLRALLIAHTF